MELLLIIILIIVLFLGIILVRGALFRPIDNRTMKSIPIHLDQDKIVAHMKAMIQCKTISYRDESKEDKSEFLRFEKVLEDSYPLIHSRTHLEHIGRNGLLYFLEGIRHDKPEVLMSHYDVVPVDEGQWDKPAFDGLVEGGFIWGRGTLDTKGTLCGIMEATEQLLAEGYIPAHDLYFSFSGEEEIDGDTCKDIVSYLENKGISPSFVLDEGGAIVNRIFPGVTKECALIGIAEKGSVNVELSMESQGGHASTPPTRTIVGKLAGAAVAIEKNPCKRQFTKPVQEMFNILGRYSTFSYRVLFANMWCFLPLFDLICKKSGGELNAMMRTTCALTKMEGSSAFNVLPPKANIGLNMRLMGSDTLESAKDYLKKTIKDPDIQVHIVNGMNPSITSNMENEKWEMLKSTITETWGDVLVSPYLMMACSDSRHYCRITDRVYRFSAMKLSKEERAMIHGHNERIPVETLVKTVEFYVRLLKSL